ncbi:MAG TPA: serine/threonine-protein kinase [Kofleriaceae bacterium]|nr:serine/threonine-protein kinase [Kofleriaceae bacterium]
MAEVDPQAPTRTIPSSPSGPRTGDRVGRYVIEREIGAGGMGVVVEARDPELQRQVALKLVRPDAGDRAYTARLVREARAMAKLEHPNVVRVYDSGEVGGEVFVAMELVVGRSLGAWLRAVRRPWRDVLARFVEAGRGLAAAHAAGMVHRDFKPDNVLVRDSDGSVAVTDFGLAVPADREHHGSGAAVVTPISGDDPTIKGGGPSGDLPTPPGSTFTLTRTGVAVGTPPYMAPEQHMGADVDARADIFSFCASLYEGVYGERPFAVDNARRHDPDAWSAAIARGPRPAPKGRAVPASLRRALLRGLAANPSDRWPSMDSLLVALRSILSRRRRAALVFASLVVVGTFAAVVIVSRRTPIDRCGEEAARVRSVWGPTDRARVDRAIRGTGKPYAPQATATAIASIDRWSTQWHDVRETTCRDAERGALPESAWRTISACLDQGLIEVDGRIELLSEGGDVVDHARQIASLPSVSECSRLEHDPLPSDARWLAEIRGVQRDLAETRRLHAAGNNGAAFAKAHPVLWRARGLGWRPLIDDAANEVLRLDLAEDVFVGEPDALAREIAASAAERGDDLLALHAWQTQLDLADTLGRYDGLDYLVQAARAAATRASDRDEQAITEALIGVALAHASRPSEARATCETALARVSEPTRMGDRGFNRLLSCKALVEQESGDWAANLSTAERLLAELIHQYGPRHIVILDDLQQIANSMSMQGRTRDALVVLSTAHAMILESRGADSGPAAMSWSALAQSQAKLGNATAAREALDHAKAIVDAGRLPPPTRDEVLRRRASTLLKIGDTDAALATMAGMLERVSREHPGTMAEYATVMYYAQALEKAHRYEDAVAVLGKLIDHPGAIAPSFVLILEALRAESRLDLHRADEAARDLGAAWERTDRTKMASRDLAEVADILSDAYEQSGDQEHARSVGEIARAAYAADGQTEAAKDIDKRLARLRHSSSGHE